MKVIGWLMAITGSLLLGYTAPTFWSLELLSGLLIGLGAFLYGSSINEWKN